MSSSPANGHLATSGTSRGGSGTLLAVRGVAKRFGDKEVLKSLSLDIAAGEFITLLGESGSGKTTLLRMIAGFEQPTSGEIWMSGERLDIQPAHKRRVNTVFQQYALFPHLSVRDNVAYGLRVKNAPKLEIGGRVDQALQMVKMSEFANAKPTRLSGGQQQRVALARALINRPQLLLLDEPLSALDANLRKQMQSELKSLQREVGITFLFVTHDQEEAMALSDRIALLRNGALEQVAAPREIYAHPATAYTAQFIGQTNLLRADIKNGIATCGSLKWSTSASDGPALFSLRPEAIQIAPDVLPVSARYIRFRGTIQRQVYGGASELLEIECGTGQLLRARIPARNSISSGQEFSFLADDIVQVKG
ncbi:MAG TPA: ABC transporter ATP-binding protein [Candidatus Acidoferrum sp.]|nr:ABC transporter ATP-binding protein [Candidatus Acidoferrum sp.]